MKNTYNAPEVKVSELYIEDTTNVGGYDDNSVPVGTLPGVQNLGE